MYETIFTNNESGNFIHFDSDITPYCIIGTNIKHYRQQAKLTQAQLAEQAQISISYLSKIEAAGYTIVNHTVYRGEQLIGMSVPRKKLYTCFLNPKGIYYFNFNFKGWRPDEAFVNFENDTAYIIEKNFRIAPGPLQQQGDYKCV